MEARASGSAEVHGTETGSQPETPASSSPLLRPEAAEAKGFPGNMVGNPSAPVITLLDHRGCNRVSTEYKGPRANAMEDEQCVKLESKITAVSTDEAAAFLRGVLGSFNA